MEILRDSIRLSFALLGPLLLMVVFGYGISFDVESLPYAVLDRDQSPASRTYLENFAGSPYFAEEAVIRDDAEAEARLRNGRLKIGIEIPPGFGKDLARGRRLEVGVWLDGSMPFRGETSRGYVHGVHQAYLAELARQSPLGPTFEPAAVVETRFRYNQDFKSVFAMVPGIIMLLLMMIPAMMTAVGVVREKELGSITNLYATPVTGLEFLLGKQAPYVVIALLNFATLCALSVLVFGVTVKGSALALAGGAALYVLAATGFGMLISVFVKTQITAIFATAIITTLPAFQFSGFVTPLASLSGGARVMGFAFPAAWFQQISIGTFTKALGFSDLFLNHLMLAAFTVTYLLIGLRLLKTQER
jgi:ribosome-dependent ATPase